MLQRTVVVAHTRTPQLPVALPAGMDEPGAECGVQDGGSGVALVAPRGKAMRASTGCDSSAIPLEYQHSANTRGVHEKEAGSDPPVKGLPVTGDGNTNGDCPSLFTSSIAHTALSFSGRYLLRFDLVLLAEILQTGFSLSMSI